MSPRVRRAWKTSACLVAVALAGGFFAVQEGLVIVPDRLNPWAPLEVAAPPDLFTGLKLRRTQDDPQRCLDALARSGLRYEQLPLVTPAPGCELRDPVRLQRGYSVALSAPVVISCRVALAFSMWERHTLLPAAKEELRSPLASIQHLGGDACRDLRIGDGKTLEGAAGGSPSMHATADALDVSGFTTRTGRRVTVRGYWTGTGTDSTQALAESKFLRRAFRGACRFFDGVLGPDYDSLHFDHFHMEAGGGRFCR